MLHQRSNTLQHRVERQIREWRQDSPKPTAFDVEPRALLLIWTCEHPGAFVLWVAVGCSLLALGPGWLLPDVFGVPVLAQDWLHHRFELLGIFNAIFAIQATVMAVVYPIVIAFVALLLQQDSQSMATLRTYLLDSGVLPAGLSAIALLIAMGLIELFLLISGTGSLHVFLYGAIAWFTVNMVLATWFLYRTLLYIDPSHRTQIFTQYALHSVYPRELRTLMAQHEFDEFLYRENVTGNEEAAQSAVIPDRPALEISPVPEGPPVVAGFFPVSRQCWDVRLDHLKSALSRWQDQVDSASRRDEHSLTQRDAPSVSFPALPGERFHGRIVICRAKQVEGTAFEPDLITKNLIWNAFRFRRVGRAWIPDSVSDVLKMLVRDVAFEMNRPDQDRISEAYTRVMSVHWKLLKSGRIPSEQGNAGNIALAKQVHAFGWPALHESWADVYAPALETAVEGLPENAVGFRVSCWLARDQIAHVDPQPVEIPARLLNIHVALLKFLTEWWDRRIALQAGETDQCDPVHGKMLLPPLRNTYRRALFAYIGPWEQAKLGFTDRKSETKNPAVAWEVARCSAQFSARKLELTFQMLVAGVRRGDTEAAHILCDSFLQLGPPQHWEAGHWQFRQQDQRFLTISDCNGGWEDMHSLLHNGQVPMAEEDALFAARSLPVTALCNYWDDLRNLLILVFLKLTDRPEPRGLAFKITCQLIAGKQELAGLHNSPAIAGPDDVVLPFMRQGFSSVDYRARFDNMLEEQFDRFNWSEMVSGRVVLKVGRFDLESLLLQRVQSFCLFAPDVVFSGEQYQRLLKENGSRLRALPDCASDLLHRWRAIDGREVRRSREIVGALRAQLGRPPCSPGSARWTLELLHWLSDNMRSDGDEVALVTKL